MSKHAKSRALDAFLVVVFIALIGAVTLIAP